MSDEHAPPSGPDLARGIPANTLADGAMLAGHVGDDAVLVARVGHELFAIGATCTHYGGPLAEGVLDGDTVRCPWHHACFSLRTGDALRAPALRPETRWKVDQHGDSIFVTEKIEPKDPELGSMTPTSRWTHTHPESVVIVGAGAAGSAAAEMLRREGYNGPIALFDGDADAPYDRPNLSKDYLAGNAPEEWMPLRSPDFYRERGITLTRGRTVTRIDARARQVTLDDGTSLGFGALLIATGSSAARLPASVAPAGRVHYLRTLADSRAIIAATTEAKRAVVLGASFIGLETAASLRARGLEVHVAAPESLPLERVMGREIGAFVRDIHQAHGVVFHFGQTASGIDATGVILQSGERIAADLVVAGIGVRLNNTLAAEAGLATGKGVNVDEYLQTSAPGIFAAGDIAFWPDPHSGERIHVEHWAVAERQGQTAARNMLGAAERFDAAPFFWSQHYDVSINYVGHAERWDRVDVAGSLAAREAEVTFRRGDTVLAVATVGRDQASLRAELTMERSESAV